MKANELMIGDWVLMDLNYSEEEPMYAQLNYQPYKIQNGEDIDLACETNCIGDADVYQPIPLTREILEKNGFVEWFDHSRIARSCSMLFDKNTSFCVQEIDGSDSYFTQINRSGAGTFEHRMYIKYVHQLQQLFRLCGIDKEITLTQL